MTHLLADLVANHFAGHRIKLFDERLRKHENVLHSRRGSRKVDFHATGVTKVADADLAWELVKRRVEPDHAIRTKTCEK